MTEIRYRVTFIKRRLSGRKSEVFTFTLAATPEQAEANVRHAHDVVEIISIVAEA